MGTTIAVSIAIMAATIASSTTVKPRCLLAQRLMSSHLDGRRGARAGSLHRQDRAARRDADDRELRDSARARERRAGRQLQNDLSSLDARVGHAGARQDGP